MVDDRSTDGTYDNLGRLAAQQPPFACFVASSLKPAG